MERGTHEGIRSLKSRALKILQEMAAKSDDDDYDGDDDDER